ncbi:C-GCAxxG-C-C family (seleno)protein [Mycoplasmatota bacterium WC44]
MKNLIKKYKSNEYDLSCSEAVLYAANEKWDLNLSNECFKMVAPYSGGMLTEDTCGILTASLAVIGLIFTETVAHQSPLMVEVSREYVERFKQELKSTNCGILKENFRDEVVGCTNIIIKGGMLLEEVVSKYRR